MKKLNRREFLKTTGKIIAGIGITTPFIINSGCIKASKEIKIGYIPITDASALLVAYYNKYFKDEGLIIKQPLLFRSWTALVEAFLSNKVDVVHFLMPIPIWMRYNYKFPAKIISWAHTNGSAITVNKNSNIKSFADLGEKQIAIPYWYSMHNVILQMGLRKFGLKPVIKSQQTKLKKDEVNLFILPPPEMPLALAANKIDGYIVAEPFNALGEEKVSAKILRFTGDIWKNHPCCTIVVNENLIKSNPSTTQKIVNAIVRAQGWIIENRLKTARILSKEESGLLPVSENILQRVFTGYELKKYGNENIPQAIRHSNWKINRIDFEPYTYPSATRFIFENLKKTVVEGNNKFLNNYNPEFIVKDLVDDTFVKKAILSLSNNSIFTDMNYEKPWEREEIIDL